MGQRFLTVRVYGECGASGQACPADLSSRTSLLPACCMLCEPRHLLFTYLDERFGGAVVNCCICLNILFLVWCVWVCRWGSFPLVSTLFLHITNLLLLPVSPPKPFFRPVPPTPFATRLLFHYCSKKQTCSCQQCSVLMSLRGSCM